MTSDVQFGGGGASYFGLTQPGPGFFNIELLAAYIGQGAGNGIYFGQDSLVRNFRFNIIAITTDGTNQTTNTYAINAGPSNVSPINASPTISTTPNLTGNPTIHSNRLIADIATCTAANGSSKGDLKANGVSWIVRSAFETNATSNYPNGANLATGANGPVLFGTTNTEIISGGDTLAKGVIQLSSTVAPAKYNITVGVQDAGGEPEGTDFTFLLDLVIVPTQVYYQYYTWCIDPQGSSPCPQGEEENGYIVVIEITTSTVSAQNGFYIFDIGNEPFADWAGGNTGIITIDRTNAATSTGGGNIPSDIPAYGGNGASSYANALQILNTRNFNSDVALQAGQQDPDISENVFEIV